MLYIINTFPLQHTFLKKIRAGDTLILKESAVYAVKQENMKETIIKKTFAHLNLFVNKTDLLIRNISKNELIREVSVLDNTDEYQEYLTHNIAVRSCN